jgi:hypothetical protein
VRLCFQYLLDCAMRNGLACACIAGYNSVNSVSVQVQAQQADDFGGAAGEGIPSCANGEFNDGILRADWVGAPGNRPVVSSPQIGLALHTLQKDRTVEEQVSIQ